MDIRPLTLCLAAALLAVCHSCSTGKEFITTFLTNYQESVIEDKDRQLQLVLTAQKFEANVHIQVASLGFSKELTLSAGETQRVSLPSKAELEKPFVNERSAVRVSSNTPISVVSFNRRKNTGDGSVVSPVDDLGTEHIVYTPSDKNYDSLVGIVNGDSQNKITIMPVQDLKLKNWVDWKKGEAVTVTLEPYDTYLIRSKTSLTSTRIQSQKPVAVLAGHQCFNMGAKCEHVYDQLLPVAKMGKEYVVPATGSGETTNHVVIITSEDNTKLTITRDTGKDEETIKTAGESSILQLGHKKSVVIKSDKKVMTLLLSSNKPHDPFLITLIPNCRMSTDWGVETMSGFENTIAIVSEREAASTVKVCIEGPCQSVQNWHTSDSKWVWSHVDAGKQQAHVIVKGDARVAVYAYGGQSRNGYGIAGVCSQGTTIPPTKDPCEDIKCKEKEQCVNGACVHTSTATCSALGDPHYTSFDGKRYDFQGSCTYIMATVAKPATGLVLFNVTTKNTHRGSKRVSYVKEVTITVYGHKITIGGHRRKVEVDGELLHLPFNPPGGKIKVVQSGSYAVLTTEFGLAVKFDWKSRLYITVPSSFYKHMGGLCGDYNGDKQDDLPSSTGNKISDVLEMIKEWKVDDPDLFCTDNCGGSCPECSVQLQEHFRDPERCGRITKEDGPFAACHKIVSPSAYLSDCVYDVCFNKGAKQSLCDSMQTYFEACLEKKVALGAQWREQSGCFPSCPVGSHYEPCASACPASCSDLDSEKSCNLPCVEACLCDEGLVLSGDRCVPQAQCGCQHQGKYYPAGTKFWGDSTCTSRCECKNGKAECKDVSCKENEQCTVKKGIRDCYPTTYGSCWCSGDPHCWTLDKRRFDFQGTCTYVLSKLKPDSKQDLEPFQVLVTNEIIGRNTKVSYTKSTSLTVFGNLTVSMSRTMPGKIMVNGKVTNLPYTSEDGKLSVYRRGWFGVVTTTSGLVLKFNWKAYVKLTLPSSYSGETVGLCGNFNDNKVDDFMKSDGTLTNNVNEFGGSWKVGEDTAGGCTSDCPGGKCPECEPASIQKYQQRRYCGIISDKQGPFSQCHSELDYMVSLENCAFDMCMYEGHASALCSSLSAFSTSCQEAGAKVGSWRQENFCPPSCPPNSHYEVCSQACQMTCSLTIPEACDESANCVEGCVCDDGFLLSNDECVPLAECGCEYGGEYYRNGEVFFPEQSCDTRCVCSEGQIQCNHQFKCSEHEECALKDGSFSCQPKSFGSCSVCGERTISSFDGQMYPLYGNCLFTLSAVENNGKMPAYSVTLQQKVAEDGSVSRSVEMSVYSSVITMEIGKPFQAKVDGIRVFLPRSLEEGKVQVQQNGRHITVEADFGLKLAYDTKGSVYLQIPSTYQGAPTGLCGNFNTDPSDDLVNEDALDTAAAWLIQDENVQCEVSCGAAACPEPDKEEVPQAKQDCDIIRVTSGPFEECHSTVDPNPFYQTCVSEMATHKGGSKLLCRHIESYVTACQLARAKIKEWRSDKFCPLTCPSGSHYELFAPTSSSTCSSLQDSAAPSALLEGCQCDGDMLFDGAECVSVEKCGCHVGGRYYKSGTSVMFEDCLTICSCESGVLTCDTNICQEGEECLIVDGTVGCISTETTPPTTKDPCEDVTCKEKELCVNGECVHTSTATCTASGDPHYVTFDGKRYDFQGSCTYIMATVAKPATGLVLFNVTTKNTHRGSKRVSFVKEVTITVYGHKITIGGHRRKVEVDGELLHLPFNLPGGKIKVVQSGSYAVLTTEFGLAVKFDWKSRLYITVPSSFYKHMGGLCGDYNGDKQDDLPSSTGNKISDVLEMIKKWKVDDPDLFCTDNCGGSCPECSVQLQEHFRDPERCGRITKEDGPFAACHKIVSPSAYLSDCVYDVCFYEGAKQSLCDSMQTYFEACLAKKVTLGAQWREQSGCFPSCPAGSHYEPCASACPASCSDPDSEKSCNLPCVEACLCDEGLVLSGDRCVPQAQCGCQHQGKYYPAGTKFWGDSTCTSRCECKNGKAECKDVSCKENEQCTVKKGIRDCYPTTYGSCWCSGDPHCWTLDKRRLDFQGTCTYVLSKLKPDSKQDLEPFQVLVTNEIRGRNTKVSYTKSTSLTVFGNLTVSMSRTMPGKIMVNGKVTNLPYTSEDGKLSVYRRGWFGVVTTTSGLVLKFNWKAYVKLTVPGSYSGETVGLCGNFNDNKDDDFMKSDGTLTNNVNEFGGSWKVGEDTAGGCTSDCPGGKCPECEPASIQKYQQRHYCGIISNKQGPFSQCHSELDYMVSLENCAFDMCMYEGHASALCSSLSAFSTSCQEAGAKVGSWRQENFCPPSCPPNSHYEVCPEACQMTCSLTIPEACDESANCVEGCVCDDGFLLSNDECVPLAECGCEYGGEYYRNGEVFFPEQSCDTRCVCSEGQIQCNHQFKCSEHEECALKDGSFSCQPKSFGSCSVCGERTISSFDGQMYPLYGNCLFTLSAVENNGKMPAYSVKLQQKVAEDGSVSRSVELSVYSSVITMEIGKPFQAKVDGIRVFLPRSLEEGKVQVQQNGRHITVEADFGLKLAYDTKGSVYLQIPSTYQGVPIGLCGNFNTDPSDDLVNEDALDTAAAWLIQDENVQCEVSCGAAACPEPDKEEVPQAKQDCDIIRVTSGPFEECHSTVDPNPFYQTCVTEMATHKGGSKLLCRHIESYVTACQLARAKIKEWRSDKLCPLTCPSGSHYELFAPTSSSTCSSLQDAAAPSALLEGCQCDGDMLFDGAECVSVEKCGCHVGGRYYKAGTPVLSEDCSQICSCNSGELSCKPNRCQEGEECRNKGGIIGCSPIDPCADVECRVKEHCEVSEGQGVCVPDSKAMCWAFGDPHFTTLDGKTFSFQGTCSYVFFKTTGLDSSLPDVSVTMKGELRGNSEGSFVHSFTVKMLGYTITIPSGPEDLVLVNGTEKELPLQLEGGRISITQTGIRGTIMTDMGIEITFDWASLLMITASSSYFGNVGGLCGNFNGNKSDDMTTVDGHIAANVTAWASSWSVPDRDPFCFHHCEGECPQCSDEDRKTFTGPDYCGILSDKTGPFARCHAIVPVEELVDACLYDVCLNEGRREVLCEALSAYLVECQEANAQVGPWRELAGCPFECPPNSHYEECGSPCPATCGRQPAMCILKCVEGCFCDEGFVLSGKECVNKETGCGCNYEGEYHKPGEEFWADLQCKEKCICDPVTHEAQCNPAGCEHGELCSIVDGVQDCYPMSFEICTARGDPHYKTFDKHKYNFQGNCVYRLASVCKPNTRLKNFEITTENENRKNKRVSYARGVTLKVFNSEFTLSRDNPGKVLVDGLEKTVPFKWNKTLVHVYTRNRHVVIQTHFLKLSYDFLSSVKLELATIYEGAICGLCGNMNGDPADDFMLPNGKQASSANDFGVSQWVSDTEGCSHMCKDCPPPLPPGVAPPIYAKDCNIITDQKGPLAQCIDLLDSKEFYEDCVYDMLLNDGDVEAACETITEYVEQCQILGGEIKEWRTKKFCPMKCPPKSEYSLTAPGCPVSCSSRTSPADCKFLPSEGCVCKKGFLMSKEGCVKLAKCGCNFHGQYLEPGEGVYDNSTCSTFCKCNKGVTVCKKKPCKTGEKCTVVKGVRGCYDKEELKKLKKEEKALKKEEKKEEKQEKKDQRKEEKEQRKEEKALKQEEKKAEKQEEKEQRKEEKALKKEEKKAEKQEEKEQRKEEKALKKEEKKEEKHKEKEQRKEEKALKKEEKKEEKQEKKELKKEEREQRKEEKALKKEEKKEEKQEKELKKEEKEQKKEEKALKKEEKKAEKQEKKEQKKEEKNPGM